MVVVDHNPFEVFAETSRDGRRKPQAPNERLRTPRDPRATTRNGTIGPEHAPKILSPLEKKLFEQSEQLKMFRKWKNEVREGLKTGEYGPEIVTILRLLKKLPDAAVLINVVHNAIWLRNANEHIRMNVLSYIDAAMMRWNIRNGYPVFNDSLPGEPDSPFIIIRKLLTGSRYATEPSRNTKRSSRNRNGNKPIDVV